jgi:NAD(P)-dependent dehydrogenase (short-subunit alcohol dehydrogenase family)
MDETRRLEGRRALVTGSATGIGRSTVMRLTAEGAAAIVNYVGPSDPAGEVVE